MAKKNNFSKINKLREAKEKLSQKYIETKEELETAQNEALIEVGKQFMNRLSIDIEDPDGFNRALDVIQQLHINDENERTENVESVNEDSASDFEN